MIPSMGTRVGHRGLTVLFMAIFLVMMGFGIVLPVLQFYAREVGATPVQIGLLATSYAFTQFLFAPFWGALSDRIGRKPVFALGLLGYAVPCGSRRSGSRSEVRWRCSTPSPWWARSPSRGSKPPTRSSRRTDCT